jgi:uncharacterized protein (DUF362 family)
MRPCEQVYGRTLAGRKKTKRSSFNTMSAHFMRRVSLIKGEDRREIIHQSLELVADDIKQHLSSRQPVIKPNLVSPTIQLASSHVDQMRGILDFLTRIYKGTIIIAEASCYNTKEAYANFGYPDLLHEYDVSLVDLNEGPFETVSIGGISGKALTFRIAGLLLDAGAYVISAAKMKTHDTVVVSLSVKNLAMGSVFSDDKKSVHQGIKETNRYIAGIAEHTWPDLSVIDGFEGMEGDGPTRGDPVSLGVAIASVDALAADRVACEIMGVDFHSVGYLHYCAERGLGEGNLGSIEVLGERVSDCVRPFRLHRAVNEQYAWK